MKAVFKEGIWKILKLFYENPGTSIHLREIARRTKLNENSVSRFLNVLDKEQLITSAFEGNLRKLSLKTSKIPLIFPIFDREKYEKLPTIRRNAMHHFFEKLPKKPIMIVLLGSTAKGTYTAHSDIDLLLITNSKIRTENARDYAESQTGIRISDLQICLDDFKNELKLKKDAVIQSAIKTGYPVFNGQYYYGVKLNQDEFV